MEGIWKTGLKRYCTQILARPTAAISVARQLQSLRFMSGRRDCNSKDLEPKCSKEKLATSACAKRKKKEKAANAKNKSPFKSMWLNPECCKDPCPDVLPRFDELYYKPSDKAKRKYSRTWVKCPKRKIKKKVVCKFEKLKLPKIKRRKKCDRPKSACIPEGCGRKNQNHKCMTLKLPGCRSSRHPPKCHIVRVPTDCTKVCCPYPAFSECKRDRLKKGRPTECDCLRSRSACSLFDYLRKQTMQKSAKK